MTTRNLLIAAGVLVAVWWFFKNRQQSDMGNDIQQAIIPKGSVRIITGETVYRQPISQESGGYGYVSRETSMVNRTGG